MNLRNLSPERMLPGQRRKLDQDLLDSPTYAMINWDIARLYRHILAVESDLEKLRAAMKHAIDLLEESGDSYNRYHARDSLRRAMEGVTDDQTTA